MTRNAEGDSGRIDNKNLFFEKFKQNHGLKQSQTRIRSVIHSLETK